MEYKVTALRVVIAVLLANSAGFALKYFELDTFIILLGFRFHLSAVLPLLLVVKKTHLSIIKQSFVHPAFNRVGRVVLTFIFASILFLLALYLAKKAEVGDPEYFYEFGLSSVADFPIYLLWNSLQLGMLYLFFIILQQSFRYNFIIILIFSILLFAYEFIPTNKVVFNYESISALIFMCIISTIIIKFFNSIYLFVFIIFSTLWFSVLAFGSESSVFINLLLAANYFSWEGFFAVDKNFYRFITPIYYLAVLLSLLLVSLLGERKSN